MQSEKNETARGQGVGLLLAGALAVAAGLIRLIPHPPVPWNLTPIGALGLFGGARLRSWHAYALPVAVMVTTDFILWAVHGWAPFSPHVYACFLLNVLWGRLLTRTESPLRIGGLAALTSVQFFLITNFGVWAASSVDPATLPPGKVWEEVQVAGATYPELHYARNLEGLAVCYLRALPFYGPDAPPPLGFFGNTLLGDLFFTGVLFGAYALLAQRYCPSARLAGVPVLAEDRP